MYAAATLGTAWLYFYLLDPAVAYKYDSLQIPASSHRRAGVSFALVAAAHCAVIARIASQSLRHRRLVFQSSVERRPSSARTSCFSQSRLVRVLYTLCCSIKRPWDALFGRNGYFGLNGSGFDAGFEAREAAEIVLQTYQAFNLSASIPKRWINSLAVAAIVTNCCVTPLAHVVFRGKSKTLVRRVFCRAADMLLDSCCSLVVPLCILYPYWRDYDGTVSDFPPELFFDDVWFVNAIAEARYVLVTSVPDYISTLVPHASILSCLLTIESLLQRAPGGGRQVAAAPTATTGVGGSQDVSKPDSSKDVSPGRPRHHHQKLRFMTHSAFLAWGMLVGIAHLFAQLNGWENKVGCKLHVNAWFTTTFPCSVMEVNCFRQQQMSGDSEQIEAILQNLDRLALRTLIITHCPALHMPPAIQEFPHLGGIEIFNCSIAQWGIDAAVREEFMGKLTYIFVMYSNLSGIPEALLHRDLPPGFSHLIFFETNLSRIPENVDAYWGSQEWVALAFTNCSLREVPVAVARLSVMQLSLDGNLVASIAETFFARSDLMLIDLSRNPLLALPDSVGAASRSSVLDVVAMDTNISSIPSWLRKWAVSEQLSTSSLYNTPFCDALSPMDLPLLGLDVILPQRQP